MILATAGVVAAIGITMIPRKWGPTIVGASLVVLAPILGVVAIGLGIVVVRVRRISERRRSAAAVQDSEQLLVDLVALGVTAGLSFEQASVAAATHVRGSVGEYVSRAVRRTSSGLPPGVRSGPVAELFAAAGRTTDTGAPLAATLIDMARHSREESSARESERLEKLPVKLLFPLAFLILPGFVLVAVVPTVVSGLGRLGL